LFQQLHYQRQLKAVVWLNVEREPRPFKLEPAHLEGITLLNLAEHAVEQHYGHRQLEQRFADIDLCPYFVPDVLL
jgi:hypothetical protein